MILATLLAMQPAPPPRIDFDSVNRAPPVIMNANATTCARWNERHAEDRTARVADMAWLQGFLDGQRADSPASGKAYALALGSMDTDCQRDPGALVIDTARAMLTRLRGERP